MCIRDRSCTTTCLVTPRADAKLAPFSGSEEEDSISTIFLRLSVAVSYTHLDVYKRQELRSLRNKKSRDETRSYFVEGISLVLSAIEHNAPIRFIVYSPELLDSEVAYAALSGVKNRIPCYEVKEKEFRSISARDNPMGLGAVISYHDATVEFVQPFAGKAFVALDSVGNPGNLGTIIRTADCFGFSGVFMCGESTDQYLSLIHI